MNKSNVLRSLLLLPREFYSNGNISAASLLEESGYLKIHEQINETNIKERLQENPEIISEWQTWSENKRSDPGWYLKKNNDTEFVVGNSSLREKKINKYDNLLDACAAYIKKELEEIRKNL